MTLAQKVEQKRETDAATLERKKEARRLRDAANLAMDDVPEFRGGYGHIRYHVERVADSMPDDEGKQVLDTISNLAANTPTMGKGGASELYAKLAHFLCLDGAILEGKEPWPQRERKKPSIVR
jgi:hypothetical protein